MEHRTIDQKPRGTDDFAKARELIEIRAHSELSLQDRRVINVLYKNAGEQLCEDVEHVISIAELRGSHKGGERVKASITRLMRTTVEVATKDRKGNPATMILPILSDTTVSDDDNAPGGQVVYSFSRGMRQILKASMVWGRVHTGVIFSFTSKYSLALYELIAARVNLNFVWSEDFAVDDLRSLLGVPEGKLERIPNLLQKVINPAVLEVNGLADFGVRIDPIRRGGKQRGLVTGFRVSWWRKNEHELKEAFTELRRTKVGRLSRLRGETEKVAIPTGALEFQSRETAG